MRRNTESTTLRIFIAWTAKLLFVSQMFRKDRSSCGSGSIGLSSNGIRYVRSELTAIVCCIDGTSFTSIVFLHLLFNISTFNKLSSKILCKSTQCFSATSNHRSSSKSQSRKFILWKMSPNRCAQKNCCLFSFSFSFAHSRHLQTFTLMRFSNLNSLTWLHYCVTVPA